MAERITPAEYIPRAKKPAKQPPRAPPADKPTPAQRDCRELTEQAYYPPDRPIQLHHTNGIGGGLRVMVLNLPQEHLEPLKSFLNNIPPPTQ